MVEQAPGARSGPLISVRGTARLEVEPDSVQLAGVLRAIADSKAAALAAAAAQLTELTEQLSALGGVRRTSSTATHPLTWLARSTGTQAEQGPNEQTGQWTRTGRIVAHVAFTVVVRDFRLLGRVSELLAEQETVELHQTSWRVDEDNPRWRQVRADAVHDAIRQARDYAAALGGTLLFIEHLSDVGLLGTGNGNEAFRGARGIARATSGGSPTGTDAPALDPEPQQISATVEARFTTTNAGLTEA